MKIRLPLEVLGFVAPVLTWVERRERLRLPRRGQPRDSSLEEAEKAWLRHVLPTYSHDTVDEILQLTRGAADPPPADWLSRGDDRRQPMVPPADYDLTTAFDHLGDRYFQWNGNELCVRAGRLEELHELGSRFPLCHLIRHRHASALTEGFLTPRRALELPERLSALPSASRSLRVLIERGLSEGHLHFWGVTHADEVWANHLLARPAAGKGGELSAAETRLLQLGRFSLRILALALLLAKRYIPRKGRDLPYDLLRRLDELYYANSPWTEWKLACKLDHRLREELETLFPEQKPKSDGETAPLRARELDAEERAWLLSIIDPDAHRILYFHERRRGHRPAAGNPLHRHVRSLERLHLGVQQQLIELSQTVKGFTAERRDSLWSNCYRFLQDFLHQAFFRYLVYHTHHMQLAIQGGTTTGLREFREFYGAPQRQLLGRERIWEHSLVLDRLFDTDNLRRLEGRTRFPAQGCSGLMPWLVDFAQRCHGRPMEKLGIVIHFIKQSHDEARAERRRHRAEQRGFRVPRLRHEAYRRNVKHEAFRLFHQLSQPHPVVPFIVGIDAANVELTTPPELLAPAFRFLREFPIESRNLPSLRLRFGVEREVQALLANRRLGVTYHVGEDFRHLISGLRAIYEVITFMDLKPGDRMGHATALALNPKVWAAQVGYQAVLTKQEWLDSLVWLHHFLGPGHDLVGELGIEDEIQYLSWHIFKEPHITYYPQPQIERARRTLYDRGRKSAATKVPGDWSPLMLWDAWRLRQLDPTALSIDALRENKDPFPRRMPIGHGERRWVHVQRRIWNKIVGEIGSYGAYELLERYWYGPQVRRRGDEVITVDMGDKREQWMAVCLAAQEKLKDLVQHRQLVVEVNPSCNRMVGPMQQLAEHHIFDLTLDEKGRLARKVVTTVNTDNPGVLNTSLAHEYYLLGEILLRRGVPEGDVVEWLEWLRTNGEDYTFLRFLPAPGDNANLRKILKALRKDRGSFTDWLRGDRRFPGVSREPRVELTERQKQALLEDLKKEFLPLLAGQPPVPAEGVSGRAPSSRS